MPSKKQILKLAEEQNISFIRLQFTDMSGEFKNVEIPVSQLKNALENEVMFDGSSIEGFSRIQESDMYLYPDLDTWIVLPSSVDSSQRDCAKVQVARLICDVYTADRKPFEGDPRGALKRVLNEAKELGFSGMNAGPEPEFFLFKKDGVGNPTTELNDHAGYFDLSPLDSGENCRREIVLALEKMGMEAEAAHHEVAPGQHEVNFKYADAVQTADNIQTFKMAVRNVASKNNMHATFMPKPAFGINGSGMHCNLSLFDGVKNAFYEEGAEGQLSKVAHHFIAGLLKHARANAAITNPTVNSYKRLVPGYEAPVYCAWSSSNRTCMIRIPATRGAGTRVEVRHPDPTANPYLALAVLLKAGLEGVREKLNAPKENREDLFEMSQSDRVEQGIQTLPQTLNEALDCLKKDEVVQSALGHHIYSQFLSKKESEWESYQLQVSNWEREQYFKM